jgi:endonuclease/exonuclease/phosphatase family metal-dependent hydrolase
MRVQLNRREALLASLAAVGVLRIAPVSRAQELLPPVNAAAPVRLFFYNTHLLPGIAQTIAGHRGQDEYRTAAIAAKLHRYDLIGLCEVFESDRRREIIRIAQQDSRNAFRAIEQPKPWGRHFIGSGLLMLSRYPIEGEPHFITYRHASRIVTNGWKADGFAAKGAIHARLRLREYPAAYADCFLTHLESVSAKARAEQVKELAGFIAEHASLDRPAILMGDLNVAADFPASGGAPDSEYLRLANSLTYGAQRLVDLWPIFHAGRGGTSDALAQEDCRRIDYVFISPPQLTGPTVEPLSIRVEPFLDEKVKQGSLSDHAALECNFALR